MKRKTNPAFFIMTLLLCSVTARITPASYIIEFDGLIEPFEMVDIGTVTIVDRVIDPTSGTFGVRLELPNPGYRLPGGLKCMVGLPDVADTASPAKISANITDFHGY